MWRVLARSLIAWLLVLLTLVVAAAFWMRAPVGFVYRLYQHESDIAHQQRWLSHRADGASIAADLRRFAAEQRWDHPEKANTRKDFFYPDDSRLPDTVRRLRPSWVQIDDETIDIGCGEVTRDQTHSFGLYVWRDPNASGHGTTRLGPGIWYYQDDHSEP